MDIHIVETRETLLTDIGLVVVGGLDCCVDTTAASVYNNLILWEK